MAELAINIGGSKIALAARKGARGLFASRFGLDAGGAPQNVLSELTSYLAQQCARYGRVDTIAIASAPNLDRDGRVERWPNRPAWAGAPIVATLAPFVRERIVWCDNGTAATLADARALGTHDLIHFSLGTGVSGGICINGSMLRDYEPGHLLVHAGGAVCSCGRRGCLQAYASGRALEQLCARYPTSVAQAHWLETAAEALAVCSANLLVLFRTRRITLSGRLVQRFPILHEAVARALRTSFLKRSLAMPEIAVSPYGGEASLYGALALAAAPEVQQRATGHCWSAR